LIASGIKGIWNFTSTHLQVPEGVIVKRENLATSLIVLSHRLRTAKLI
jgi:NADH/NAD ratio-sensing transcriptional regulator Rex